MGDFSLDKQFKEYLSRHGRKCEVMLLKGNWIAVWEDLSITLHREDGVCLEILKDGDPDNLLRRSMYHIVQIYWGEKGNNTKQEFESQWLCDFTEVNEEKPYQLKVGDKIYWPDSIFNHVYTITGCGELTSDCGTVYKQYNLSQLQEWYNKGRIELHKP